MVSLNNNNGAEVFAKFVNSFKNCVAKVSPVKLFPGCINANLLMCHSANFALPGDYTVNGWLSLRRRAGGRDDFILTTKPQEVSFSLFSMPFFATEKKETEGAQEFLGN